MADLAPPSLPPGMHVKVSPTANLAVQSSASNKRKWARRQAFEYNKKKLQHDETGNDYNIWYDKFIGGDRLRPHSVRAETRCDPERDTGLTKADIMNPENAYFCIHFARGNCVLGAECHYFHRLATMHDFMRCDPMHDIFGRERHRDDRDDMGGIGSFNRDSRTLYVTGFVMARRKAEDMVKLSGGKLRHVAYTDSVDMKKMEEVFARHFGQWGSIEEISVKPRIGCVFVRFIHRCGAEYAKVAMADQSLDNNEQISVRWAYDDPNPKVITRITKENEERMLEAMVRRGFDLDAVSKGWNLPIGYQLPPSKPPGEVDTAAADTDTASGVVSLAGPVSTSDLQNISDPGALYPDTSAQFTEQFQTQQQGVVGNPAGAWGYGNANYPYYYNHGMCAGFEVGMDEKEFQAQRVKELGEVYGRDQSWFVQADGSYGYVDSAPAPPPPTTIGPAGISEMDEAAREAAREAKELETRTAIAKMNGVLDMLDLPRGWQ